jgi:hypothetical protein
MPQTTLRLDGRDLIVHSYQDVENIIEENKRWQNAGKQIGGFRKTASIPNNIILQWLNEEWARGNTTIRVFREEFDRMVACKLRDPDWKWLRTS